MSGGDVCSMQLLPVKTDLASSEVTMIQIVQRNGVHVGLDLGLGMRNKSKLIPGTGAGMGHKSQLTTLCKQIILHSICQQNYCFIHKVGSSQKSYSHIINLEYILPG